MTNSFPVTVEVAFDTDYGVHFEATVTTLVTPGYAPVTRNLYAATCPEDYYGCPDTVELLTVENLYAFDLEDDECFEGYERAVREAFDEECDRYYLNDLVRAKLERDAEDYFDPERAGRSRFGRSYSDEW